MLSKISGALGALLIGAAAGCAVGPQLQDFGVVGAVELTDTPFYPQNTYENGPAALATMLSAQGVGVNLDDLIRQVYVPEHKDSMQADMIAAVRGYGLVPYVLRSPHVDLDLVHEVQAGHPVMVLQNPDSASPPQRYYAVVIGVDPRENVLTLRSGVHGRVQTSFGDFLATWRDSQNWAMVVTKPDQLPATATASNWVATVAPFEQLGKPDVAARAYTSATKRWPQDALGWEALGNARYEQHDLPGSSQAFSTALTLAPQETGARNNLAQVLLERYCVDQAETQIEQALAIESDPARRAIYSHTQAQIKDYSGPSVVCPSI